MAKKDTTGESVDLEPDFWHIQPCDHLQSLFRLYNQKKIQANVILAASFDNTETQGAVVAKAALYPALQRIIKQYPELAMVYTRRQSEKNKAHHRGFSGFLRRIDLDDHVEFHDVLATEENAVLTTTLEEYHSIWFDQARQPPWKLMVINGRHVILVFDHYITDGRGAAFIMNSLLEALNSSDKNADDSSSVELDTEVKGFPEQDPLELFGQKDSLWSILNFLLICFIKLLFRKSHLLFHDLKSCGIKDTRILTKLSTLRLNPETVKRCLQACRKHNVSFTSLFYTLIQVTLATDFYPNAKISHSLIVVDGRRFLPQQEREKTLSNCGATLLNIEWLSRSRQAGQADNNRLLWSLIQERHKCMTNDFSKKIPACMKSLSAVQMVGDDEEDFVSNLLPVCSVSQDQCWIFSNLGAFHSDSSGPWSISNMEFSAGATKARVGTTMAFNIAGVQGAGTVIHANYERGSLPDDFGVTLLGQVERRMNAIIQI